MERRVQAAPPRNVAVGHDGRRVIDDALPLEYLDGVHAEFPLVAVVFQERQFLAEKSLVDIDDAMLVQTIRASRRSPQQPAESEPHVDGLERNDVRRRRRVPMTLRELLRGLPARTPRANPLRPLRLGLALRCRARRHIPHLDPREPTAGRRRLTQRLRSVARRSPRAFAEHVLRKRVVCQREEQRPVTTASAH